MDLKERLLHYPNSHCICAAGPGTSKAEVFSLLCPQALGDSLSRHLINTVGFMNEELVVSSIGTFRPPAPACLGPVARGIGVGKCHLGLGSVWCHAGQAGGWGATWLCAVDSPRDSDSVGASVSLCSVTSPHKDTDILGPC